MDTKDTKETKETSNNNAKVLLTFLERTKNGEYAPIEKSSLQYIRIKEETELTSPFEDEYYYSFG